MAVRGYVWPNCQMPGGCRRSEWLPARVQRHVPVPGRGRLAQRIPGLQPGQFVDIRWRVHRLGRIRRAPRHLWRGVQYAKRSATGWQCEVVDSQGVLGPYNTLAVDASGQPTIGYYDATTGALKVARKSASGWSIQTVTNSIGSTLEASLKVDSTGAPVFVFVDPATGDLKMARWHPRHVHHSEAEVGNAPAACRSAPIRPAHRPASTSTTPARSPTAPYPSTSRSPTTTTTCSGRAPWASIGAITRSRCFVNSTAGATSSRSARQQPVDLGLAARGRGGGRRAGGAGVSSDGRHAHDPFPRSGAFDPAGCCAAGQSPELFAHRVFALRHNAHGDAYRNADQDADRHPNAVPPRQPKRQNARQRRRVP